MERNIVHLDLDTFFVSVARLENSSLRGIPVLIGGSSDRGVVASCSYEARQFGIHSAMPMKLARQLCPEARLVPGDYDSFARYSKMVTDIIAEKAPIVEKASIDEHYLDLTGMDKHFGCWKWMQELRQHIITESGLPISFGLSVNKTVSKIATGQAKPNGEKHVFRGGEKEFLAPLSIRKIPMIGSRTFTLLRNMGIARISTLQKMDLEVMARVMGVNGVSIWKKANGLDDSPVVPYSEKKSISKEHTFDKDTIDMELLKKHIVTMVDELAFELRKEQKLTSCLTLKIRYSNFETYTRQIKIDYTASDRTLSEQALALFHKLYSKRMLIRLIGVKCSDLVTGSYQIDLFNDAITELNLSAAMDNIRTRFGTAMIKKAMLTEKKDKRKTYRAATFRV
ncbi:DNA polymerase IV [Taibaiella lutea]|uniref:DNA polymerase IV n=1 Tax=Taibaiella lutea TaxID=2608001 RepID=A0A5M6CMJ1_9BACT|nr:DNA polymerase IV [Taibaiella lutea]KAA5536237.1 DNA polymerase IV [Taibaiella lutea]